MVLKWKFENCENAGNIVKIISRAIEEKKGMADDKPRDQDHSTD